MQCLTEWQPSVISVTKDSFSSSRSALPQTPVEARQTADLAYFLTVLWPNITPRGFSLHVEPQVSCPRSSGYSGLGKPTSQHRRQLQKFSIMLHFGSIKTAAANRGSCSMSETKYLWNFQSYGNNLNFTFVRKQFASCTTYCKGLTTNPWTVQEVLV